MSSSSPYTRIPPAGKQPAGYAPAWDHVFFLHRPAGGIGVLVYLWLLIWFGHEAAGGWKGIDLGWPTAVYYILVWACGTVLGWVGADRPKAGAIAGGLVGLGGLAAVGLLRAVWPTTPDGLYAAAMAVGLVPGFVAYQSIRNFLGEEVLSQIPESKTLPDILVTGEPGSAVRDDHATPETSPNMVINSANLFGRIDADTLLETEQPRPVPLPQTPKPQQPRTTPDFHVPFAAWGQGIASIVLGVVPLLMAAPAVLLAYTLLLHQFQGVRDSDRKLAAYGGYIVVIGATLLAWAGLRFGQRGVEMAALTGEPESVPEAGLYISLLAVAIWMVCGLAWHTHAWALIKL